jgi:Na+/H+ antiporter NhaC
VLRYRRRVLTLSVVTLLLAAAPAAAQEAGSDHAGWLSLLPPLIAIALALLLREVIFALFAAVASGALLLAHWNPFVALARTVDTAVVSSLADADHASILVFSSLLGAMVGVVSKSGGARGIVELLRPYATSSVRGQVASWLMGVLIYFDDYANTLIVGTTMRPITDRLRISREKLAYIVDSTAAPVASLIPLSTWVGFEIGLLQDAFAGLEVSPGDAFGAIVASLPYRFYQVFALALGLAIALSRRDFGPMLAAERRAVRTGALVEDGSRPLADFGGTALEPPDGVPHRARNAALPLLAVLVVTIAGLWITGTAEVVREPEEPVGTWIREVLSAANSYQALLWASLSGVLLAGALALAQRVLDLRQVMEAALDGVKAMLGAFVVLLLAWGLGDVCDELGTASYLVQVTAGILSPHLVPALTFVLSASIAFATGTSWGTMGILTPLVVPLADSLLTGSGLEPGTDAYTAVLLGTIAAVLSGSVWGDHCSPISDTTILSSMASGCDHIAHVRTQLPYAFAAGGVALVLGNLPAAFGISPWLCLAAGIAVLLAILAWRGTSAENG